MGTRLETEMVHKSAASTGTDMAISSKPALFGIRMPRAVYWTIASLAALYVAIYWRPSAYLLTVIAIMVLAREWVRRRAKERQGRQVAQTASKQDT